MKQNQLVFDRTALKQLEERLKRGIPKWEQADFIEMVVPQLVDIIQRYERLDAKA